LSANPRQHLRELLFHSRGLAEIGGLQDDFEKAMPRSIVSL
jgi:hypothetical protein